MEKLSGVIPILPTPFLPDGQVDAEGLVAITKHLLKRGVGGLCFGFGSEYFRLTEGEREQVVAITVSATEGALPVIAPCTGESVVSVRNMLRRAKSLGASMALVNPPSLTRLNADDIRAFVDQLGQEELPLMVQDAPQWSGVELSIPLLVELCGLPQISSLKIEAPPTWVKIRQLRHQLGDEVGLFGGYGGLYLLPELRAGADGVMPSAAHPELYQGVINTFLDGEQEEAEQKYRAMLPYLIVSSASLDTYVWLQKEILRRHGLIQCSDLRAPARKPDEFTTELWHSLASRLGVIDMAS